MSPEKLEDLANRIDFEELWRLPLLDRDKFTPEQRDRLDAGVNLRRYARQRGTVVEKLKEGAEYLRGYKIGPLNNGGTDRFGTGSGPWHAAINAFSDAQRQSVKPWPRMMYTALLVASEVPRMILLFEIERKGQLRSSFKMCGHDPRPATPLPDNHLRCALGRPCRDCPFLQALDASPDMTPEAKDEAKAWTCATHILLNNAEDTYFEQFIRDKCDDAFDDRLAASFSG